MNDAEMLCVSRKALHISVSGLVKRPAVLLALALAMDAVSAEVSGLSAESQEHSGGENRAADPSLSQTGIAIDTKVFRVAQDGTVEALKLEQDQPADEPEAAAVGDAVPLDAPPVLTGQDHSNAQDNSAAQESSAAQAVNLDTAPLTEAVTSGGDPQAPSAVRIEAQQNEVIEGDALNRVTAGDRLRYELIVRNTNDFTVPALALEVIERLPPGVRLSSHAEPLTAEVAKGWLVDPEGMPTAHDQANDGAPKDVYAEHQSAPAALHWVNTEALPPGGQMVLVYDVVVVADATPPEPTGEDSGNGLDYSQTQLQPPQ